MGEREVIAMQPKMAVVRSTDSFADMSCHNYNVVGISCIVSSSQRVFMQLFDRWHCVTMSQFTLPTSTGTSSTAAVRLCSIEIQTRQRQLL